MIKTEAVSSAPEGFMELVSMDLKKKFAAWLTGFGSVEKLSPYKFLCSEEDKPLLFIGSLRMSFLSASVELWMFPTHYLTVFHLPELRGEFMRVAWPIMRDTGLQFVAKTAKGQRRDGRFIEFFGGRLVKETAKWNLYEVNPQ